jgi:hypothetical protein
MELMRNDSGDEDTVLEDCLRRTTKHFVYAEKRTNACLNDSDDLEADDRARQAVRELVDLRLIYLIDHNTSRAPSGERRDEAYNFDKALYDNVPPRNLTQIEPDQRDERARKDELRASPVFALKTLRTPISELPVRLELTLSEE